MDICELSPSECAYQPRHPWETSRRWLVEQMVESTLRRADRPIRQILDVGCGDAFIARRLAERHPQMRVAGVDRALSAQVLGRLSRDEQTPNLRLAASLAQFEADGEPFGMVLLLDVLEHVPDDWAFLADLAASPVVDREAFFLVTVPAFRFLYCSHDRLLGHLRRYRLARVCRIARGAGLDVLEGGYCYFSGFWFRAQRSMRERWRLAAPLEKTQVASWQGGNFKTWFAENILRLDLIVCRLLARARVRLPGLSCYLLCQRRG